MSVNPLTLSCLLGLAVLASRPQASSQDAAGAAAQSLAGRAQRRRSAPCAAELDPAVTGVDVRRPPSSIRACGLPACPAPLATTRHAAARHAVARAGARGLHRAASYWTLNVPVEIHRKIDVLVLRRAVGARRNHRGWRCAGAETRVARASPRRYVIAARGSRWPPDPPADPRRHRA